MNENIITKIKHKVVYSPLHKPVLEIIAAVIRYRIERSKPVLYNTIYIISPYKTGTTYIDSLWNNNISKHEPFHLYSLKYLNQNFNNNFRRRSNKLRLKMECSGFLSMHIEKLPQATVENGISYIYILRPPNKWVLSVLSHFSYIKDIGYNYIDFYYWTKLLNYSMINVLNSDDKPMLQKLIDDLFIIYFKLLDDAINNQDIYFVELRNINDLAEYIGAKIGVKPNYEKSWKRKSETIFDDIPVNNSEAEERYRSKLSGIPKSRNISSILSSIEA